MPRNPDELGALWQKTGKKGAWFSGTITINGEKIPIVVFPNNYKESDKHPDWKILRSRPKGDQGRSAPPPASDDNSDIPY